MIDAKSGVSGAGPRADRDARTSSRADENVTPYGVGAPPPHARDRPGARARSGARRSRADVRAAPGAARPGRARLLLRARRREPRRRRAARALRARPTPTSRSSSWPSGRPGCATCATRTSAASTPTPTSARGKVLVFAAIDNLWKGAASQAVQNLNLMFGLDETARAARERRVASSARAGSRCPSACARRPTGGLPAGFRAAGVAARASSPAARTDVGAARLRRARHDERRALHALGRARRAGARLPASAARLDALRVVVANSGNANAATGGRGLDDAAKMQGAAAMAGRRRRRPGRRRLDRRHRRASSTRGAVVRGLAARPRRAAPRRRRRLRRGDHDDRRLREARLRSRSSCPGGTVRLSGAGQGRGDDPAGLRDDAVLRADRRRARAPRPPTCCSACA